MGRTIDRTGLQAGRCGGVALLLGLSGQAALAQEALSALPAPPPVAETAAPPASVSEPTPASVPPSTLPCAPSAAEAAACIPALTPVRITIKAHLGSKISTSGDTFALELADPIVVDGKVLVPAGTTGMGEVVHAKNSGGSGAGGELILAARYLEFGGRRMRLRSLNFAVAGTDAYGTVQSINVAAAVAMPALSLIGFLVKGKGIDIPEGMEAMAKTAEPFVLDPPAPAPPAPTPVSPPPEQGTTP